MSTPAEPTAGTGSGQPEPMDLFVAHLNLKTPPSEAQKAELGLHLAAATEVVEAACGPLSPVQVVEEVALTRGRGLLARWPVIEVVSVTASGVSPSLVATPVATDAGELLVPGWGTGVVTATYRAGRVTAPPALVLAVLIIGKHLWETQRGPGAPRSGGQDPGAAVGGSGFAVPRRAAELIALHRAPRVGAA